MMRIIYLFIIIVFVGCNEESTKIEAFSAKEIHLANQKLIDISMEDIFNPPVATRVFCYPNLIAFETYSHKKGISPLNNIGWDLYSDITTDTTAIDYSIAALHAYTILAKKVVFSEHLVDSLINVLDKKISNSSLSNARVEDSKAYGSKVANTFLEWIKTDNYAKVKSDAFYTNNNTDSSWVLTPPSFEPALEPNWPKMRPITIKNLSDFEAIPRPVFSKDKNSEFYKGALLVYDQSKSNTEVEKGIAKHWDCNPNEYVNKGHNTIFLHRISPPGHWVNIATLMCNKNNADLEKSLYTYASATTAMFDGIISCWNTKYSNDLIRPVTYINRYIDNTWEPYIQTPPFPEYTSGHSVASGTATSVLDYIYENTAFIDSTEVEFGLPVRSYKSIVEAGEEASMSRFYGGIHYKYGIDNGLAQGRKIGTYVVEQFKIAK
jgi:hypothetical protein